MAIKNYKNGSNVQLSENFNLNEFLCKGNGCCTYGTVDDELVSYLQKIRDHFGKPVRITSAYRCPSWNADVGGVKNSYHTLGQAADIKVEDTDPAEVAKYAESIGVLGIGLYNTAVDGYFVHIDTRKKKSFWYGQKQAHRDTFGGVVENTVETVEKGGSDVNIPTLYNGCTGNTVKAMQLLLIHNGYNCGSDGADGNFGKNTEAAVKKYQSNYGLSPDGICGVKTWSKLLGI